MKKAVSLRKYESLKKSLVSGKEDWTEAVQKAINENESVYIPQGKYYIGASIIVTSNRRIKAARGAEIILLSRVKTLLLRNKSVMDGSRRALDLSNPHEENISIEGGFWAEENTERLGYGKSGTFDEAHSLVGVSTCMLFSGVKNLRLKNMRFGNTAGFAVQLGRCENIKIENIRFIHCFADGIHINGYVKNGFVKNVAGEVGDDLIALNAYDWENSTINNGPIENLRIENVFAATTGEYKSFRIQAGIVPREIGEIDCYIKDLYVHRVEGISVFKLYLQTPAYSGEPDGTKVGRLENITIDGVKIILNSPVDQMENYMTCNPLTGNFGAFELGSNISKLTLKNIDATINKTQFPTLHLITAGPKSSYLKDRRIELFDPYITSETEEIEYKNIRVNGEKTDDLRSQIKEVAFPNDMYEGQYGVGGSGKVKKITKIK